LAAVRRVQFDFIFRFHFFPKKALFIFARRTERSVGKTNNNWVGDQANKLKDTLPAGATAVRKY
jgi:hypothetical protein